MWLWASITDLAFHALAISSAGPTAAMRRPSIATAPCSSTRRSRSTVTTKPLVTMMSQRPLSDAVVAGMSLPLARSRWRDDEGLPGLRPAAHGRSIDVRRILLAGLYHETNTFVAETTGLDRFSTRCGAELLACAGDGSPIDGFLEVAAEEGWVVVPSASFGATPSGPVVDAVFDAFWAALAEDYRAAGPGGIDAVYLALHGAMVTETMEDPEGELLRRIRALAGGASLPIFGVFDLHASVSPQMAANANGLVAYRENPHTD